MDQLQLSKKHNKTSRKTLLSNHFVFHYSGSHNGSVCGFGRIALNILVPGVKKITKKESLELFERVINMIKQRKRGFFYFKKLKGVHGYCEWDEGIILDYRKDLIPTIIHECIHFLEPDWSEAQVMYAESRVVNSIKEDDVVRLLLHFVKKL